MPVDKRDEVFEVLCALLNVKNLLKSGILWSSDNQIIEDAVFTQVLISLTFALLHSKIHLKKIDFKDDVILKDDIDDVTDLIQMFRNSACHQDSEFRYFEDINNPAGRKSMFGTIHGKGTHQIDNRCESKYDDDVAYFTGTDVLYLKRHIERAFKEVVEAHNGFIPKHVLTAFYLI